MLQRYSEDTLKNLYDPTSTICGGRKIQLWLICCLCQANENNYQKKLSEASSVPTTQSWGSMHLCFWMSRIFWGDIHQLHKLTNHSFLCQLPLFLLFYRLLKTTLQVETSLARSLRVFSVGIKTHFDKLFILLCRKGGATRCHNR